MGQGWAGGLAGLQPSQRVPQPGGLARRGLTEQGQWAQEGQWAGMPPHHLHSGAPLSLSPPSSTLHWRHTSRTHPIASTPCPHHHPRPQVFNDESHRLNVYGSNVEVDYRGYEVTVENFIRVLTGMVCGCGVEGGGDRAGEGRGQLGNPAVCSAPPSTSTNPKLHLLIH